MKNTKKRMHRTSDPTWHTYTYSGETKSPFDIEMIKYYNESEGRDQILFLYKDKTDGKIFKYRILQ